MAAGGAGLGSAFRMGRLGRMPPARDRARFSWACNSALGFRRGTVTQRQTAAAGPVVDPGCARCLAWACAGVGVFLPREDKRCMICVVRAAAYGCGCIKGCAVRSRYRTTARPVVLRARSSVAMSPPPASLRTSPAIVTRGTARTSVTTTRSGGHPYVRERRRENVLALADIRMAHLRRTPTRREHGWGREGETDGTEVRPITARREVMTS
jgi:hypothetical protein